MRRAAGTVLLAETTGRTLLLERADGSGWCHPGGWSEPGEQPEETAQRELDEETGLPAILTEPILSFELESRETLRGRRPLVKVLGDDRQHVFLPSLVYTLFVVTVREEFVPTLNDEHTDWQWTEPADALLARGGLHPGCAAALDEILERSEQNA
jgi:8-oxo-dGTP pyrophosphatase MutT (NUDIX family)